MDLEAALAELYAVPSDGFMSRRGELVAAAKADGETELAKAVGSLRKPSLAAWAVNQLVRQRPDDLGALLDLGDRLRRAQATGAGEELRELGRERSRAVSSGVRAARAVAASAGQRLSSAVERDVEETLTAALSSPAAAEAVSSGALTRALSYAGLGEVDLSDATAGRLRLLQGGGGSAADTGQPRETAQEQRSRAAEERLAAAERAAAQAAERLQAATDRLGEVTASLDATQARVDDLEQQLDLAREELGRLTTERGRAGRAHRDAEQAARAAVIELDGARGGG